MDNTLLITFGTLLITGLGTLAVAVPQAYLKMYSPMSVIWAVMYLGVCIWNIALDLASSAILPHLKGEVIAKCDAAISALKVPMLPAFGVVLAGLILLGVLYWIAGEVIKQRPTVRAE
jgi:hypothetical protein